MTTKQIMFSILAGLLFMGFMYLGYRTGHVKLKKKIAAVEIQRDILSDCIRCSMDEGDSTVSRNADFYLGVIGETKQSLNAWSYCY